MILSNLLYRRLLKMLLPISTRLTPLHCLRSERSPIFSTGTTWPSRHSSKSKFSFQNSRMKLKWTFRFFGDMTLKAWVGTPFKPGALLLVISFTASLNYFQEGGASSSYITSSEFMLFKTFLWILFLLFYNFPKCFANTLALSSSVSARSPDKSLIWNNFGDMWWAFSNLYIFRMFSQASLRLNNMLWIVSARCLDHLAFMISIILSTSYWSVLRFNIFSSEGGCWSNLMVWRIAFMAANSVVIVLLLWWNHPLLLWLFVIADFWALSSMASLKSL